MSLIFRCFPIIFLPLFFADEAYSAESTFLYEEELGGPYVDEWFLVRDASEKPAYHLQRQGKSGELLVRVTVDCGVNELLIGQGILFGSERVSEKEATGLVPDRVIKFAIARICKEDK